VARMPGRPATLGPVPIVAQILRHRLTAELATFGLVGGVCLVTDIVLFNVLAFGAGMAPVLAKAVTMLVTGTMAFVGHRKVTFRHRRGAGLGREAVLFTAVTAASLVTGLTPIWLVRSGLDHTGPVWLNAANLVGIALGSGVRYLAYRHVVWGQDPGSAARTAATAPTGAAGSAR
jgi:putative flippase GtrA